MQQRTVELKESTKLLEEERQRFNRVLDMLPAYVILLTPDYHVPFANRFFRERFGESNGRRVNFEYLFGRSEPCEVCETYTVLKTNAPCKWEWTGPDGRNYDISDFPFTDTDGATLILEMGIDITERKQAEAELKKHRHHLEELVQQRTGQLEAANSQLQAVFDVVNVGMLLIDEDGRVKRVNDTLSRWVGRDLLTRRGDQPGDLIGCAHAFAEHAGCGRTSHCDSCPIRSAFASVLRSGQPVHDVETESVLMVDGSEVRLWLEVSVDPLVLDGKRHAILAMNNITARKQAEEALRQTAEELARSNEDLGQFAYVASHDLQEPLRMVTGFLQLLHKKYSGQLDADADQFIEHAVDGAKRMQNLINDLLTYSRVGTNGRELTSTDVGAALQRALSNLQASIEETAAEITHDELPTVPADGGQLTQLFQNLIGNALKFRSATTPKIHVDASRNENGWQFSVRDNGIGIAPEFQDRIFLIFQRLHTRRQYPGTGIGLAICKRIADRHGGQIWVESQPGQGATFHFTIPT